jgi:hypothetical protein
MQGNWMSTLTCSNQYLKEIVIGNRITAIDNNYVADKFNIECDIDWNCFAYCFTKETYWRSQNYRFLTGSFTTRKKLALYKIIETDECPFCNEEEDDLTHALLRCPLSRITWQNVQKVLVNIGVNYDITFNDIIFGVKNECKYRDVINLIMLRIKYKLASPKHESRILDENRIIEIFKSQLQLERVMETIRLKNKSQTNVGGKWGQLFQIIDTIT